MSVEFSSDIHDDLKNSVNSEVLSILTSNRSACCKTDDGDVYKRQGLHTYKSTMSGNITVPLIAVDKIDVNSQ